MTKRKRYNFILFFLFIIKPRIFQSLLNLTNAWPEKLSILYTALHLYCQASRSTLTQQIDRDCISVRALAKTSSEGGGARPVGVESLSLIPSLKTEYTEMFIAASLFNVLPAHLSQKQIMKNLPPAG